MFKARSIQSSLSLKDKILSIDYILEIGKIIHYDFSEDLKDLKKFKESAEHFGINSNSEDTEYWKNKYLNLLEKYNLLLESKLN